jgi:hypothetical protein
MAARALSHCVLKNCANPNMVRGSALGRAASEEAPERLPSLNPLGTTIAANFAEALHEQASRLLGYVCTEGSPKVETGLHRLQT